jgi:glucose dehydrogenase
MAKITETEICIVGAGLAGGLLAYYLTHKDHNVALIEAGPSFTVSDLAKKNQKVISDQLGSVRSIWELPDTHPARTNGFDDQSNPPYPLHDVMVKGVGGNTLAWLGNTLRFHPDDFLMASKFGVGVDWPIQFEELVRFYQMAEHEMGVAGKDDNPWLQLGDYTYPLPSFDYDEKDLLFQNACDKLGIATHTTPQARNSNRAYYGRPQCDQRGSCIPICSIGAKYSADYHVQLAKRTGLLSLFTNCPVFELSLSASGEVETASFFDFSHGEVFKVKAENFVLAANTIETTRLLQTISAKSHRNKFFLDPYGLLGKYFVDHPLVVFEGIVKDYFPPRGFQTLQSHQFYVPVDRGMSAAFKLEFSTTPQFNWDKVSGNQTSKLKIIAMFEMLPNEKNHICLSDKLRDDLGNPLPRIKIELSSYEKIAMDKAKKVCTNILEECNTSGISASGPFWGAAHPSGTYRAGLCEKDSIVNSYMQHHCVSNLYLLGAGAFPTISAVNPALTIAALALRTANLISGGEP